MNKKQFLTYFLPIILFSIPAWAMEEGYTEEIYEESDSDIDLLLAADENETQEFLVTIAQAMKPGDVAWESSSSKIKDIIWALALFNYEQPIEFLQTPAFLEHMQAMQKSALSKETLKRMMQLHYKIATAETIAKTIMESHYNTVIEEEELETGIVTCLNSTAVNTNTSKNPDKSLSKHEQRHQRIKPPIVKQHKRDLSWKNIAKPCDILSARELLHQRYGIITFESDKKDFHCVFRDCTNKNLLSSKKALIRHFKQNHMNKIDEINNNKLFAFTLTPALLARVTNYSNDVKPWKRNIKQESL